MLMRKIKEWKVGEDMVSNFSPTPEVIDHLEKLVADTLEPLAPEGTVILQVSVNVAYSKIMPADRKAS